ncbi:MAG TPA: MFS transporter, partial [Chloroflexota bacterium]|nr:MFS transporter [Chloroflexota bacterium]
AIKAWGWQSPFALLVLGGLLALVWTALALPRTRAPRPGLGHHTDGNFAAIARVRSAWLMLAIVFAFLFASDMIAISYASFLERAFNVDVLTLGGIVATFALADLSGELLSMWGVDRFGKKRALLVGFAATTVAYFAMPLLGASLTVAVAALFVYYVCFEFTIVSVFPLISELVPQARATLLSLVMLAASVGRMLGAFSGALTFSLAGFGMIGIFSGSIVMVALVVFALGVREARV